MSGRRNAAQDARKPPAYPKELAYPCCLPTLGELGKISPRGGPDAECTRYRGGTASADAEPSEAHKC